MYLGCLSRILIFIHPGSRFNNGDKRGGEKLVFPTFFYSEKYHKLENYFIFEQLRQFFLQIHTV